MTAATLTDLLCYRAQHQPNQIAYTFLNNDDATSLTYQVLDEQARSIAQALIAQLTRQNRSVAGSRAVLVYPYSAGLEFIAAFLGCLYAGVVAVPCYPPRNQHAFADLQARLDDAQATVILTTKMLLPKLMQLKLTEAIEPVLQPWLTTDALPTAPIADWVEPRLSHDTLAFVQYTSGSTGKPKGVIVTHGCILENQRMIKAAFGHSETTICMGWLPLFHDMGLIGNVLQPLYLGIPVTLMSPIAFIQKPIRWLQAITRYQATTSGAPNFAYDLLCQKTTDAQRAQLDLSCWQVAFCGAEPVRAETIDRFVQQFEPCGFRREAFYPCYGMAEATLFISGGSSTEPPIIQRVEAAALEENRVVCTNDVALGRTLVGCGRAGLNATIAIVDPDSLTRCAPDRVGEIWVSHPGIGKGYWQQPEETAHTFQAYLRDTGEGPFLRTGDLGFLQKGELFITGRLKDVLIFWGFNHYPQHIEQTVEQCHPALRSNASAAFSAEIAGTERLVIFQEVERAYRQCLVLDEVVTAIRWAVFREHLLDVYAILLLPPGSIPKTSSGKIQHCACRDQFLNGSFAEAVEWRSSQAEPSNLVSLIEQYMNPITHLQRYAAAARGRLKRSLYQLLAIRK